MAARLDVITGDVLTARGDVLVLKYANSLHGADAAVAKALGADFKLQPGQHAFFDTHGKIGSPQVLVLGVGPLRTFEYSQISSFAESALKTIADEKSIGKKCPDDHSRSGLRPG